MARPPAPPPAPGVARLSAVGLALGLVAVVGLVLVQRPTLGPPSGAIATLAPSAPSGSSVAPSAPPPTAPAVPAADRILGTADAPVAITVWSDYQCPACGVFARQVLPRIVETFVAPGRVRVEYRDFAFIGPESIDAAAGARCAARSAAFEPFHALTFANQQGENLGAFAPDRLAAIAVAAGLDEPTFRACTAEPAIRDAVAAETAAGRALGIAATPSLVVGGTVIRGVPAWDELVALIEAEEARR